MGNPASPSRQRTVAIIPVRGGSRGIPRKNARLLAGKPLLCYGIEALLRCPGIDRVYVSTDDDELAELARRNGVATLRRPDALAEAQVGLDEVILDAVQQLESEGESFDYVITLQATSPLIKSSTIEAALGKCIAEQLDTVLTVVNRPHLAWGENGEGAIAPLYEKRLNRQLLPPHYLESGSVVVASRAILDTGTRFGKRVGVMEIDKAEAIDIDDYFDWWLAEKSLTRRTLCFHVVGHREVGLGHVYRALTLADRLIDHNLYFLVNEESRLAAEIIESRYYPVKVVPRGRELGHILVDPPDLLINDVLDTDETFMRPLRDAGIATINFEDLGPGSRHADYVVNEMYDSHPLGLNGRLLSGPSCCCLRDEFYTIEPRDTRPSVKNVLVLFGGTDPSGMTLKTLDWLDRMPGDWSVTVVLGKGYHEPEQVRARAPKAVHPTQVINGTSIISRHMAEADVAITSAGRTVFELGSLGVPMVVIAQNEREMTHTFAHGSPGVVFLGLANTVEEAQFRYAMEQLVNGDLLRRKMSRSLIDSGLRDGIRRVTDVIHRVLQERGAEQTS